jgi:hypothetical protein
VGRRGAPGKGVDEVGELGDGEDGRAAQVAPEAVADRLQADRVHGERPLRVSGWLRRRRLLRLQRRRRVRRRRGGARHRCAVARPRSASGGEPGGCFSASASGSLIQGETEVRSFPGSEPET